MIAKPRASDCDSGTELESYTTFTYTSSPPVTQPFEQLEGPLLIDRQVGCADVFTELNCNFTPVCDSLESMAQQFGHKLSACRDRVSDDDFDTMLRAVRELSPPPTSTPRDESQLASRVHACWYHARRQVRTAAFDRQPHATSLFVASERCRAFGGTDPLRLLPDDVVGVVCEHLGVRNLLRAASVSRAWKAAFDTPVAAICAFSRGRSDVPSLVSLLPRAPPLLYAVTRPHHGEFLDERQLTRLLHEVGLTAPQRWRESRRRILPRQDWDTEAIFTSVELQESRVAAANTKVVQAMSKAAYVRIETRAQRRPTTSPLAH